MSNSQVFVYACTCFVSGVFFASFFTFWQNPTLNIFFIFAVLFLFFFLLKIFFRIKNSFFSKIILLLFFFLFFLGGILRHQTEDLKSKKVPTSEQVLFEAVVLEEPILEKGKTKVEVYFNEKGLSGKILVFSSLYPKYKYGDKIRIEGAITQPVEFEDFNWKDYLKKDGIFWVMYYPEIRVIGSGFGSPMKKATLFLRAKMKESLARVLPLPELGLAEALLFGDETSISENWKEKLNVAGVRHIAAVSGMNIVILQILVLNAVLSLGFWRKQAFLLSFLIIFFYILMIGAPASGVRAAIMGSFFLLAQYFGRISDGSRALLAALFLMLAVNPFLLRYDTGFQLSFLATAGLFYLMPFFLPVFKPFPNFLQLRSSLAATLSAFIFTFPVLVYNFKKVSIVSGLANVAVLPLVLPTTVLGLIVSFLGMFFLPIAKIFSWILWLMLKFFFEIIDFFSSLPFASLELGKLAPLFTFLFYFCLIFFVWRAKDNEKLRFLNY